MWSFLTNPIVSHLLVFMAGAGGAWVATHHTAVTAVKAAVSSDAKSIEGQIKGAVNQLAKDVKQPPSS